MSTSAAAPDQGTAAPAPTPLTNVWRVLIIDEDMGVHADVRQALRALKVSEIQSATSTQQALSMLSQFRANLIILDIQIRGAAGLNFLRMLRAGQTEADKNMPVVVIARNMDQELGQKSCDSGIHNFIRKPLVAENLQKRLASTLKKPKRLIAATGYFGPDRRNPANYDAFGGEERRGSGKAQPQLKKARPRDAVKRPEHFAARRPNGESKDTGATAAPAARKTSPEAGQPQAATAPKAAPEKAAPVPEAPAPKPKPVPVEAAPAKPEAKTETGGGIEAAAQPKPKNDTEGWQDALGDAEKKAKANEDLGIDVAAVVSGHEAWLASKGAQGEKANLNKAELAGADLSGANLASANMRDANLEGANLSAANLLDVDLRSANICAAQLKETTLDNAKLRHAEMKGALLLEANLKGADLAGADFKGANLLSTDIRGAKLMGANLTQKQIDQARGDETTELPPGLFIKKEK